MKYLLNESGEVLGEFDESAIIRVYNPNNFMKRKVGNKMFYKLFKDSVLLFSNENIHYSIFRTFFKLVRMLEFDTNEFVSINGLPANIEQISKFTKIKLNTLKNHLRKLEKIEVLRKIKNGRARNILINPYFISYGQNNTYEALQIFSKSIWAKSSVYSKRKKRKTDE